MAVTLQTIRLGSGSGRADPASLTEEALWRDSVGVSPVAPLTDPEPASMPTTTTAQPAMRALSCRGEGAGADWLARTTCRD